MGCQPTLPDVFIGGQCSVKGTLSAPREISCCAVYSHQSVGAGTAGPVADGAGRWLSVAFPGCVHRLLALSLPSLSWLEGGRALPGFLLSFSQREGRILGRGLRGLFSVEK